MSRICIPDYEYKERIAKAAKLIREKGLDVMLVVSTESDYANARYFSGFWPLFERAGVAIAGAFSLVRFRSVPGNAREILSIFMAMAVGLATGVGYVGVAIIFTLLLILANFLYSHSGFGETGKNNREIKITVPEDLNYSTAFSEVFEKYTKQFDLKRVKTTNMGSLYRLTYSVVLRNINEEKEFLDALRTRNGNLEIICNYSPTVSEEL